MYVLFAFADTQMEWNCSQWRALGPSNALNASGKHTARCLYLHSIENYLDPTVQDAIGPADVVFVQRNLATKPVRDFCDYWRGMGKLVLADLDDAYPILPWSNPAHAYWILNKGNLPQPPIEALTDGLKRVDGLTSPSKQIIDDWKDTVHGYWLPNWATGAWYKGLADKEHGKDGLIIGWGGSVSHYDSWWGSGIREALNAICAEFPHVTVKVCGNDRRIFEQLPVPSSQKIHQGGVPPEQWPGQVATFDIGLAPLSGPYDQRRSWIKALEYLLVGIPWVATEGVPYEDFAEHGTLIPNGINEWHRALREVVVHYDDYLGRARENVSVGVANTLEERIDDYVNIFERASAIRRDRTLPGVAYVNWAGVEASGVDLLAPVLG